MDPKIPGLFPHLYLSLQESLPINKLRNDSRDNFFQYMNCAILQTYRLTAFIGRNFRKQSSHSFVLQNSPSKLLGFALLDREQK